MKILFIAHQVSRKSNGGMESATRIFEALSDDLDWILVTNADTKRTQRWRERGAKVYLLPFNDQAPRWVRLLQLLYQGILLRWLIWRERPAIVHSNDIRSARSAMTANELVGLPLVHTVRDTKKKGEVYGAHWRHLGSRAAKIVALSEEMACSVGDALGLCRSQIAVINSIVDTSTFFPAREFREDLRRSLGLQQNEMALGIVAGLFEKKGQLRFLCDVFPSLVKRVPNIRLHLIGDFSPETESYAKACQLAVSEHGLEKSVVFHGYTAEVHKWLQALDLVVIPSEREGLARCMIEAMACGTPVVSNDVCSAMELLEYTGAGTVVPQGDYTTMINSIIELCECAGMRQVMGQRGAVIANTAFSAERVRGKWLELYRVAGRCR